MRQFLRGTAATILGALLLGVLIAAAYGPLADVQVMTNAGAPVNGTTGAGVLSPGGLLIDTTNYNLYMNANTKASPTFAVMGLSALDATELGYLDGVTAGTAAASKALVLSAGGDIATVTSATISTLTSPVHAMTGTTGAQEIRLTTDLADALSIEDTAGDLIVFKTTTGSQSVTVTPTFVAATINSTNVDAGASGTAGTVDVFPGTASKGKIQIAAVNNTNDSILKITNAAQDTAAAGTRTLTIPNLGADGYFVFSTAALTLAEADVIQDATAGTAVASKAVVLDASKDFAGIRNLTVGTNGAGGAAGSLVVNDGANPGAGITLTYADVALIDGLTAGTVTASKALTASADKDLTFLRNLYLGTGGASGVAGSLVVNDGANPGTATTITQAELAMIDAITAGTAAASKALVLSAGGDIQTITSATITTLTAPTVNATNIDAGANAVAGTIDVFPTTDSKGKLILSCTDNTTNHTFTITNGPANGGNVTVTVPALTGYAGVSTAALTLAEMDVLDDATAGTAVASKAAVLDSDKVIKDVRIATAETADGTIPAYRLVKGHTDGTLIVGTLGSLHIVGANGENAEKVSTNALKLVSGYCTVVAAEPIFAGEQLKCGDNGRVLQLADADNLNTVIGTGTAGNFSNQPANDGIEILSSEAADTSIGVTIIGTTNGGHTVVVEEMTTDAMNGTTFVASTKVDWGLILAVKIAAAHAGTITVREASGDAEIIAIATGTLQAGVVEVAAASQGAHGLIPYIKADGASVKEVGVKYEPATGAADAYGANALNGTNAVALPAAANLVKEIYLGDVATGTAATVYTNATEDDENAKVGKAAATLAAGATGIAWISP